MGDKTEIAGPERSGGGKRRRSISRDLTVSLIAVLILFQGILLGIVYMRQSRSLLHDLESKADEYAANLSAVLALPIWDFDDEQIGRIGTGFASRDIIQELTIRDAGGKVLFASSRAVHSGKNIRRSISISHRGQVIGNVEFALFLDAYQKDMAWLRNILALILAVSLVGSSIIAGFLLRVFMRKPFSALQKGIDRIARGDYGYRFQEIHHEELEEIASRFQQMAADIQAREDSLQKEVSERIRVEEKIRRSQARMRALLDALPDLMFQFDSNGVCIDFEGSAEELYAAPKDFLHRNIREMLPGEVAHMAMDRIRAALDTGQMQIFDYTLPIKGKPMAFECRMVSVSADQVLAVVRNITEGRKAAEDRLRLEEQLQRAQKMEAIGMLAGGVAHDLNNVLSGLVTYPEVILMDLADDSPLKKPIQTIQASGERAARIVQDLLTLARRGVSVSEVVYLNDVIHEYLKSPEFERLKSFHSSFRLDLRLSDDLMAISGSPFHLSKTLMNLISNAAEALTGAGSICIATENRYIDQPISGYDNVAEGDYVVLTVTDTGVGIGPEDIGHIFEPFYTKKVMGRSGTGLGMAVVWGTVKDHKGYIDVKSTKDRGTSITIYLPALREFSKIKESIPVQMDSQGRGERLLVVDDVAEQREIAEKILARLGYRVASVSSGQAALDYLQSHPADLVLLDMIMDPGIDGLETYRRILEAHPGQKAIITSGYSESTRVREAMAMGVGAYIKKPYRIETLGPAVRSELDRRENEPEP